MLLILIGIFAAVSILMLFQDLKAGWNVEYKTRNSIVFNERNQAYGAYELRNNYSQRIMFILGGMMLFSGVLLGVKMFMDRPQEEEVVQKMEVVQIDLTPPPPVEETPPPPPPPPPPPMVEMVKFTPPVIKDDAVEEEPQKLQEEVKDVNVSTKDQEGDKDIVAPPTENTGPAETESEIFSVVEEMPEPPGGIASFLKYLGSTVRYPEMAKEAGIQGKVFLKFVVEKDGSLTDVQVLKGVPGCGDCDREAVKAVKAYPNKWKAGRQNGRELRVAYTVPFSFRLQ